MQFVPVPNCVQVEMRFTQDGQKVENVFHVEKDGPDQAGTRLTVAGYFYQWWTTEMAPLINDQVQLREIYVTDMSAQNGGSTTYVPIATTYGASVQDPLPNNVTLAVSARTSQRGRSFRGRSYVVGLTRNTVLHNRFNDAVVTAVQNAYNTLINDYIEQGQLVVVSKVSGGVPRTEGVTTPITAWVVVDNVVDSQRRRLPGRGE